MEKHHAALAAYNDIFKEQDDLYRAVARRCGLSDCAFWVLYALRESGRPMTQSDVCAAVYQPKQTVHSALKKLMAEGFLRLTEGRDRRSKYLTLTESGHALMARTVDDVVAAETAAMNTLGGRRTGAAADPLPPLYHRPAAVSAHGGPEHQGVRP